MLSMSGYKFSLLFLLLFSDVFSDQNIHEYEFRWGIIPVARLVLKEEGIPSQYLDIPISFHIKTLGPLKLIKDYDVKGGIKSLSDASNEYYLKGYDSDSPEEKSIIFSRAKLPYVLKFIDDKGVKSHRADDVSQVDPITSFARLIVSLNNNNNCDSSSYVFDGKRNMYVETFFSRQADKMIECQMQIDMSDIKVSKSKKWPFGEKKRVIFFQFIEDGDKFPNQIVIESPFGKIIGKKS